VRSAYVALGSQSGSCAAIGSPLRDGVRHQHDRRVLGAIFFTRFMTTLLLGLTATEPLTLDAVLLILGAALLAATILQAWTAMGVDPLKALRQK